MTKYHVNHLGEAKECGAEISCPFGENDETTGVEIHFEANSAREAGFIASERFEKIIRGEGETVLVSLKKPKQVTTEPEPTPDFMREQEVIVDHMRQALDLTSVKLRIAEEDEPNTYDKENLYEMSLRFSQLSNDTDWRNPIEAGLAFEKLDDYHQQLRTFNNIAAERTGDYQGAPYYEIMKNLQYEASNFEKLHSNKREIENSINSIASDMHDEWRNARPIVDGLPEKRMKDDGRGGEVDIANTPYEKLPAKWQEENVLSARSAVLRAYEANGDVEKTAEGIHIDWLSRNGEWAEEHQKPPYAQLSEEEKEKDRVIARQAMEKLNQRFTK